MAKKAVLGIGLGLMMVLFCPVRAAVHEVVAPVIKTKINIAYARPGGLPVLLDLAYPESGGPYPVIVYFHGGGWFFGDKSMVWHRMMALAREGYVVFNANYRLVPLGHFPAQVNDALGAVIYAKEHAAQYGGDPSRVGLMGDSAGAHLSTLISLAWDDPFFKPSYRGNGKTTAQAQAVIPMYGAFRLDYLYDENPMLWRFIPTRPMVRAFMQSTPHSNPEAYLKASPAWRLNRKDLPAIMLVCGDLDMLYTESVFMHLLLTDRKIPHEAIFVTGASHEFNYNEDMGTFPYLRDILNFLDRNLKQVPAKPAPSRTTLVPDVLFRDDIVWADTPSGPLRLDLAIPKGYGPYPILVYFHEGNFDNGGKELIHYKAKVLAQMGYIVVMPDYRLADKAKFPAAVNDALGAVIWAKEHAGKFNWDRSRVAVIGADAGAYLAAMTAFAYDRPGFSPTYKGDGSTDARPTAVGLLGGAYRLDQLAVGEGEEEENTINPYAVRKFLGAEKGFNAEQFSSASLASYLDARNPPPVFIMAGEDGRLYPESRWLQEQLDARHLEQVTYYLKGERSQSQFDIETKRADLPYARLLLDFLDAQTNNCGPMEGVCK